MKRFFVTSFIALYAAGYFAQLNNTVPSSNGVPVSTNSTTPTKIELEERNSELDKDLKLIDSKKEIETKENKQIQTGLFNGTVSKSKSSPYSRSLNEKDQEELDVKYQTLNDIPLVQQSHEAKCELVKSKFILENYNCKLLPQMRVLKKNDSDLNLNTLICAAAIILDSNELIVKELEFLRGNNFLSADQQNLASDMLESVDQDGILITHAFSDTYSVLYDQKINKHRQDVKVVCLDFLINPEYSAKIDASILKIPKSRFSDTAMSNATFFNEKVDTFYFERLMELNKNRNLFIASTVPKEYILSCKQELLWSGLVITNFASIYTEPLMLEQLWETKLNKRILGAVPAHYSVFAKNYLSTLIILETYYDEIKNDTKRKEVQLMIKQLKKTFDLK
jgi:hypothetical protein